MIGDLISLASYGYFGGGSIGSVLSQWQAAGIFDYALPFLLIFALTFGILNKVNIFSSKDATGKKPNNTINAILALVVALMALQFDFVSLFFADLFPKVGIALSIILVILILGGLFIPHTNKGFNWALIAVVFVIIGIVLFSSLETFGWGLGYWWRANLGTLIGAVVFIGLIIAVVAGSTPKDPKNTPFNTLMKTLGGED